MMTMLLLLPPPPLLLLLLMMMMIALAQLLGQRCRLRWPKRRDQL
jgi:hypothetical protein